MLLIKKREQFKNKQTNKKLCNVPKQKCQLFLTINEFNAG